MKYRFKKDTSTTRTRKSHWKKLGCSVSYYTILYECQQGHCAICGVHKDLDGHGVDRLYLDHDHITNKIRGLLCNECNLLLGKVEIGLNRNKDLLIKMGLYLRITEDV